VDAIGTGLLRPFLLIYGIDALRLPALTAGLWVAVVFVTNTVLVVAFQVPVTVWMSASRAAAP
jgi:hypothetical protein